MAMMIALCGCTDKGNDKKETDSRTTAEVTAETTSENESSSATDDQTVTDNTMEDETITTTEATTEEVTTEMTTEKIEYEKIHDKAKLLYMGHASIRITTVEGKVIYIDPYAGEGYDVPADLILITHGHGDHNMPQLIETQNEGCKTISYMDCIVDGVHQSFDLGYVQVDAVEAGYNRNHDEKICVGFILTFSDGVTVYVTGDTSETKQMPSLAERALDYAFFCCDGVYNMGLEEAAKCAEEVGAKHNIPYHMIPGDRGIFDREVAEQFNATNRLIIEAGEEIELEK